VGQHQLTHSGGAAPGFQAVVTLPPSCRSCWLKSASWAWKASSCRGSSAPTSIPVAPDDQCAQRLDMRGVLPPALSKVSELARVAAVQGGDRSPHSPSPSLVAHDGLDPGRVAILNEDVVDECWQLTGCIVASIARGCFGTGDRRPRARWAVPSRTATSLCSAITASERVIFSRWLMVIPSCRVRTVSCACPSFAAWLQVAAFAGLRPGELDTLRCENVDLERARIAAVEQFSDKTRTFTLPKNGQTREAPLTDPACEAIVGRPVEGEFCFAPIRGQHWTASARAYHWKAVKAAAGWAGSLYLATRHFAGWYMVNVLDLPSEDVAIALGHTDGGELVRRLYGHRDHERALDRVTAAYGRTASLTQMQLDGARIPSPTADTLLR
jgi:hypothetical protein